MLLSQQGNISKIIKSKKKKFYSADSALADGLWGAGTYGYAGAVITKVRFCVCVGLIVLEELTQWLL